MKTLNWIIFSFSISALCLDAAERVALVMGVNNYKELSAQRQLTSPVHDAQDVAAALSCIGYTLVTGAAVVEADRATMLKAAETFAAQARSAEAAVFYYSGHGVQIGEDNYLLPSDMPKPDGISKLNNHAILLRNTVMVALEESGVKTKVIVLDCCRDNPFSAELEIALSTVGRKNMRTKSLGEITGYGPGFYLAFATSPGQTAADGNGQRNSPFTAAFLKAIPVSANEDIDFFFRNVKSLLPRDQVSWTNHSITERFALSGKISQKSEPVLSVVNAPTTTVTMSPPPAINQGQSSAPVAQVTLPPRELPSALGDQSPASVPPPVTRITTLSMPSAKATERLEYLFSISPYVDYDIRQKSEILKLVQAQLAESEFDPGPPDGVPGNKSQAALNSWQRRYNLHTTTKIDHETLNRMGLMGIARVAYPAAPLPVVAPLNNISRRLEQELPGTPASSSIVTRQPLPPATAPTRTPVRSTGSNGNRDMSIEEFERRAKALQRR